jgi:uncharacterized iron-regulated membrane protein
VITGLMLFVICWSGTFAVVSNEIDWLLTPALRVAPQATAASWGDLAEAAEAAYPQGAVVALAAPLNDRAAAVVHMTLPGGGNLRVFVNPHTADVAGAASGFTVQRFFRDFHRRLFYPNPWGLYLVSLFSLTMLASLVAALLFYRRWWTRFFRFNARGRGHAFWSELHKIAGLWSLWFLLVIGLTGVWYLFEELRLHAGDGIVAYAGNGAFALHRIPRPPSDPSLAPLPLGALVARAQALRPDIGIRQIRMREGRAFYVDGQSDHWLVRDRANQLHLDPRTGAVLYDQSAGDLSAYWRWSDTADPLHFGDFGGLASKLAWFAFGLALSGLILTGTYLHARRLARETDGLRRAGWPGTIAACLVSLGVLGGSVPFGLDVAQRFGRVGGLVPAMSPGIEAFLIVWIAATLAVIAAWVFLLWRPAAALCPSP